jgi:hypothetical protein
MSQRMNALVWYCDEQNKLKGKALTNRLICHVTRPTHPDNELFCCSVVACPASWCTCPLDVILQQRRYATLYACLSDSLDAMASRGVTVQLRRRVRFVLISPKP